MFADRDTQLRQISPRDLAVLGVGDVAYVRRKTVDGEPVFAIHTADGNEVALVDNLDLAVVTIRQNDLEPVSVH